MQGMGTDRASRSARTSIASATAQAATIASRGAPTRRGSRAAPAVVRHRGSRSRRDWRHRGWRAVRQALDRAPRQRDPRQPPGPRGTITADAVKAMIARAPASIDVLALAPPAVDLAVDDYDVLLGEVAA